MLIILKYNISHAKVITVTSKVNCGEPKIQALWLNYAAGYYPYGKTLREWNVGSEDFGYQSSQKDKEKGTYYTLYRALDAEIARWHQYDPKATPFESPYTGMANNPVMYNDVLGDSSKFFNESGELLLTTHDNLENAVVIINDDNFDAFQERLTLAEQKNIDINSDKLVKSLRGLGDSYMIDEMKHFFYSTIGDAQYGYSYEHGSYLYIKNKEVRIGNENITNNLYRNVILPTKKDAYGDLHTHPNAGLYDSPTTGVFEHRPSSQDYDNNYKGFSVVISPKYIYLPVVHL